MKSCGFCNLQNAPLTDEQANRLVVLLRGGRPKSTTIWNADMFYATGLFVYPPPRNSEITAPMFEKAREILSSPQMDVLRYVQEQWGKTCL